MPEVRSIAVMSATGRQGRGVIDALSFNTGPIEYQVKPMTRSLKHKLARRFATDYPQLSLVEWQLADTESLRKCFEGCYGAFIDTGVLLPPESTLEEWTRAELELGDRCLKAAELAGLSHLIYPTFPSISDASNGHISIRYFETKYQLSLKFKSSTIPSTILCPGPFYTDLDDLRCVHSEGDMLIFSTPAAPTKRMGWADPGYDIGWFTRAVLDAGPGFMKGQDLPVCGESIAYDELASKFTAVTGIKAVYRQCSAEEFAAAAKDNPPKDDGSKALGEWLTIAPDNMTCYGTMEHSILKEVESELGIKALRWECFLERTGWRGPLG